MQYYDGDSYATDRFAFPAGALPARSFALDGAWTIGRQSITGGRAPRSGSPTTPRASTSTLAAAAPHRHLGRRPSKVIRVSGAPDVCTVAATPTPRNGAVAGKLSPGLRAYSFTFGRERPPRATAQSVN